MRWLSAFLLLCFAAGIYFAVRFVQAMPRTVTTLSGDLPALPPNVNLRLTGLSLTGRKDGKTAWVMQADQMDTTRDHNELDFVGNIRATLFQEGKQRAEVQATSAHYSHLQKLLVASGPVRCTLHPTKNGPGEDLQIESERVTWNVGERRIVCPTQVKAVQGGRTAVGEQLTVDLKTRDVTLRNFMVTLPVNDSVNPLTFRSEGSNRP